jgi:hypothetical protein
MMAAGVAGSSASGRVMRTTALANSSESPTSRPTMKSDNERQAAADHRDADEPTRCAIGEPLPGAPSSSANAAVTSHAVPMRTATSTLGRASYCAGRRPRR